MSAIRALPSGEDIVREQYEAHLVELPGPLVDDLGRYRGCLAERVSVDPARDGRKRDGPEGVLDRERERRAKGRRQKLGVPWAAAVDRPDGMDDVPRRKVKPWSDTRFAGRASHVGPDLRDLTTGFEQLGTCGAVDCAVDSATAKHLWVGSVDDGVDRLARQIALEYVDSSRHLTEAAGHLEIRRSGPSHEYFEGLAAERTDHESVQSELDFVALFGRTV